MVLVTGATGFLGSHVLCRLLRNKESVRALKRASSSFEQLHFVAQYYFGSEKDDYLNNISWHEADILDVVSLSVAMDGVQTVFHCAAMVSFDPKDRKSMFKINVEGTANVVNCAMSAGVKQLCHVSSIAALGRTDSKTVITEETEWIDHKLNSNYAISKYLGEIEVWRGIEEGLPACIVNPGVILGKTNVFEGSMSIVGQGKKGFPFYTKGVNGFVDVEDVAEIMLQLVDTEQYGERYICVGENLHYQAVLKESARIFGKKPPSIFIRPWMSKLAWPLVIWGSKLLGKKPMITKETARTAHSENRYSNEKVAKLLAFTFTSLIHTLEKLKPSDPGFDSLDS